MVEPSRPPPPVLRRWYLLVLAAALAAVGGRVGATGAVHALALARTLVVAKVVALVTLAVANARGRTRLVRLGLGLFVLGSLANALPSLVYGSMPYLVRSAQDAGMAGADVTAGRPGHVGVAELPPALRVLSDVIPVPAARTVLSGGDLVLLAGLLLVGAGALVSRTRARRRSAAQGVTRTRPLP